LHKRVVTLSDGKIINDQKDNGIYKLDATPQPKTPTRVIQTPGHALRKSGGNGIVTNTKRKIIQ
jgi:hypothetical protein